MNKINYLSLLLLSFVICTAVSCSAFSSPPEGFTIKAGALIEVIYINAPGKLKEVQTLGKDLAKTKGEWLATFEVAEMPKTERKFSHILIVQWVAPSDRSSGAKHIAKAKKSFGDANIQFGFFGSQQDTPVALKKDKIYDFTSAWLISDDPCAAPSLMQVIGGYFQNIGPVIQEYGIGQTAFMGPHPQMPKTESNLFIPHMLGIFEWQKYTDRAKFIEDPAYTAHVDVRNAVLNKMDVVFAKVIL